MARVIRSRWVYKPLHQYQVLPRPPIGIAPYNYEKEGATPDTFPERLEHPPKLWLTWVWKADIWQIDRLHAIKDRLRMLFGDDFEPGRMYVLKNTPSVNAELWRVKHLLEIRPIRFPHGEPTECDIMHTRLQADGTCVVDRNVGRDKDDKDSKSTEVRMPTDLSDDPKWLRTKLTPKMLGSHTRRRWNTGNSINEDDVWANNENVSRL